MPVTNFCISVGFMNDNKWKERITNLTFLSECNGKSIIEGILGGFPIIFMMFITL